MPAQDVARRRVRCGVIPRPEMVPGLGEGGRASSRAWNKQDLGRRMSKNASHGQPPANPTFYRETAALERPPLPYNCGCGATVSSPGAVALKPRPVGQLGRTELLAALPEDPPGTDARTPSMVLRGACPAGRQLAGELYTLGLLNKSPAAGAGVAGIRPLGGTPSAPALRPARCAAEAWRAPRPCPLRGSARGPRRARSR
jgi:hypothetical protein